MFHNNISKFFHFYFFTPKIISSEKKNYHDEYRKNENKIEIKRLIYLPIAENFFSSVIVFIIYSSSPLVFIFSSTVTFFIHHSIPIFLPSFTSISFLHFSYSFLLFSSKNSVDVFSPFEELKNYNILSLIFQFYISST